jgi:hypothetical protein
MLSFFKKISGLDSIKGHVFLVGDIYQKKNYDEWQLNNGPKVTIVDISSRRDRLKYKEHFSSVVRECSYVRFLSKYNLVPTQITQITPDPYSVHPIIVCKENDETNQNSTTVEVGEAVKVDEKVKPVGPPNERFSLWFTGSENFPLLISWGIVTILLICILSVVV